MRLFIDVPLLCLLQFTINLQKHLWLFLALERMLDKGLFFTCYHIVTELRADFFRYIEEDSYSCSMSSRSPVTWAAVRAQALSLSSTGLDFSLLDQSLAHSKFTVLVLPGCQSPTEELSLGVILSSTDLHLQSVSAVSLRPLTGPRSKNLDWAALLPQLGLCYINNPNVSLKVLSRKM